MDSLFFVYFTCLLMETNIKGGKIKWLKAGSGRVLERQWVMLLH